MDETHSMISHTGSHIVLYSLLYGSLDPDHYMYYLMYYLLLYGSLQVHYQVSISHTLMLGGSHDFIQCTHNDMILEGFN